MSSTPRERPIVETRVGRALHGDNHFRGKSVARELLGRPLTALYSLAIGGPELTEAQCRIIDALTASALASDPRIWPLKVAPLVASYGSTLAGRAGALSYFDGMMVSPMQSEDAAHALLRIQDDLSQGTALEDILDAWEGPISGFGVPARDADERVTTMAAWYEEHVPPGERPTWALVRRIQEIRPHIRPNITSLSSAIALDLGFTPHQAALLTCLYTDLAVLATSVEASRAREEALRHLPEACVTYQGAPPRRSPRAGAADAQSRTSF